jgi:hypothetical protein
MDQLDLAGFQPRTIDKVERLLDILEEIDRHPDLCGKLAMHGGTAINLFMLNTPRLSVDIDISYVGALEKSTMLEERPIIERAIEEVASGLGYSVSGNEGGHAGRTFMLRYAGEWGSDHVKIDCIYMNRSPLISPTLRACKIRPEAQVCMFDNLELAGGKVKAFFDRVKVRDLYDICNLNEYFSGYSNKKNAHKVLLYFASLSATFPQEFQGRGLRFNDRQNEYNDQLLPMLRQRSDVLSLNEMIEVSERFIKDFILPQSDTEQEYLDLFAEGEYHPELLFSDKEMASNAAKNPEALWKLHNLEIMNK